MLIRAALEPFTHGWLVRGLVESLDSAVFSNEMSTGAQNISSPDLLMPYHNAIVEIKTLIESESRSDPRKSLKNKIDESHKQIENFVHGFRIDPRVFGILVFCNSRADIAPEWFRDAVLNSVFPKPSPASLGVRRCSSIDGILYLNCKTGEIPWRLTTFPDPEKPPVAEILEILADGIKLSCQRDPRVNVIWEPGQPIASYKKSNALKDKK